MNKEKDVEVHVEDEYENELEHGLKREMKARHIAMISIGGTIGTGLFVASGSAIAVCIIR